MYSLVYTVLLSLFVNVKCLNNSEVLRNNAISCEKLSLEPYFDFDVVMREPWKIVYSWNLHFERECIEFTFNTVSKETVSRIYNYMSRYMETQPHWHAATLLVSLSGSRDEILLFADQGAGSFEGVPYIMSSDISPYLQGSNHLRKFFIKLLHQGKFLLLVDCYLRGATVSTRGEVLEDEVASVVADLSFGEGYPMCVTKTKEEYLRE